MAGDHPQPGRNRVNADAQASARSAGDIEPGEGVGLGAATISHQPSAIALRPRLVPRSARLCDEQFLFRNRGLRHRNDVVDALNGDRERPLFGGFDEPLGLEIPDVKIETLV